MINMDLCSTGSATESEIVTLSPSVFPRQKIVRFSETHFVPVRQNGRSLLVAILPQLHPVFFFFFLRERYLVLLTVMNRKFPLTFIKPRYSTAYDFN